MIGSGGLKRSSSRYRSPPPDAYYPLCGRLSDLLAGFWRSRRVAKNRISSTIKMVQRTGTLTERAHRIAEQYLDDPAQWAAKDGRCASCWQIFAVLVRRGSHVCVTLLLTTSSHDLPVVWKLRERGQKWQFWENYCALVSLEEESACIYYK